MVRPQRYRNEPLAVTGYGPRTGNGLLPFILLLYLVHTTVSTLAAERVKWVSAGWLTVQ